MYIKNLSIKNFRCFEDEPLTFAVPDGTNMGSGLNMFIGENGNGKTSVLEAISWLIQSRLKTRNTISVKDFQNIQKPIDINCETNEFEVDNVYGKKKFKCRGLNFDAHTRGQTPSESLLDPIVFDNKVVPTSGASAKDYELRIDVTRPWGASRLPEFNIFYFDKNRTRQITKGLFSTKFDDLVNDLNFQIIEKITSLDEKVEDEKKKKEKLLGVNESVRKTLFDVLSDKMLSDVLDDCSEYFNEEIKLDIINTLEPFLYAFFSARRDDAHQQLPLSRLGSGIEMVFTIVFLYHYYKKKSGKILLLIDELELHLHPIWQTKLIDFLMDISKDMQIFITTHSPYIYKNCLKTKAELLIFGRDDNDEIDVSSARQRGWGHFPWSPSWGEINYYAFNLPTVELHNELYGYLQEDSSIYSISEFESFLDTKGISKTKSWIKTDHEGNVNPAYDVTLCTYIRNKIHHPENTNNADYTDSELKKSIKRMIDIV